ASNPSERRPSPPHAPQPNTESPAPQATHPAPPTENPSASTTSPLPSFSWRELESADYHKFIANLRAIGCPEQTIRDVILAEVNKQFAPREKPLKTGPKATKGNPGETAEQRVERLRQLRALQLEKRSLVKDLLGTDIPLDVLPSSGSRDYHAFEVAFNFLPSDKRDAVQLLQEKYWQDSDALSAKYGSTRNPQFVADSRQLKDSLRQD